MRIAHLLSPLHAAVALALPPRCPACGTPVAADHRFCAGCWSAFRFLGPPWCAACQVPLEQAGVDPHCAPCLAAPPRHAGVRAAVAYGPAAADIALRLKYGGRMGLAATCARPMARLMPPGAELLVPVPLHRWRLWRRGYNQALLLAAELSKLTGVPVAREAMRRERATPSMRDLGQAGRRRAVAGAFAVPDPITVKGRAVVVIDDVHTSGATFDACTRTLLRAGAASVSLLCWARVLPDD